MYIFRPKGSPDKSAGSFSITLWRIGFTSYNELIENEIRLLSDYPDLQGGYCLVENINIDPVKPDFLANEIEFIDHGCG